MTTPLTLTPTPWVPDLSSFPARLAVVRNRMGWNVKEAATECGLAAQSWRNWERGKRPQDLPEVCLSIARVTGADSDWLMRGGTRRPAFFAPKRGVSQPALAAA